MSVNATFYKTTDDPRKIGKNHTSNFVKSATAMIYNTSSITNPTLVLQYDADIFGGANYCYLGTPFNRCYFMGPPQTLDGGRMIIGLSVDVRETWKDEIDNIECVIGRCEETNAHLIDNMIVDSEVGTKTGYKTTWFTSEQSFPAFNSSSFSFVLEVQGVEGGVANETPSE